MKAHTDGETPGKGLDGALAAGVDGMVADALCAGGDAAEHDEPTPVAEVLVGLLGDEQLAARVDGEDAVELLGRDVGNVPEALDARVRHHDVQRPSAEVRHRLLEQGLHLGRVRDVRADGDGAVDAVMALDLRHHSLGGAGGVGVVDHHARAP